MWSWLASCLLVVRGDVADRFADALSRGDLAGLLRSFNDSEVQGGCAEGVGISRALVEMAQQLAHPVLSCARADVLEALEQGREGASLGRAARQPTPGAALAPPRSTPFGRPGGSGSQPHIGREAPWRGHKGLGLRSMAPDCRMLEASMEGGCELLMNVGLMCRWTET